MAKILLVEDEEGIAFTIQDRLEQEQYSIDHTSTGIEGQRLAENNVYDLIILDVMLPGKDGFQVCSDLRKKNIHTPILMLTARVDSIDTIMGLKLGADDYLTKPFDMPVLLARVEALLRRANLEIKGKRQRKEKGVFPFGPFVLDAFKQTLYKEEAVIALNTQEYKLLLFMIQNPGIVFSRFELLDAVWGYDVETSTRTVDVHIAWLRKKLEDLPVPEYLVTVRNSGYKFQL